MALQEYHDDSYKPQQEYAKRKAPKTAKRDQETSDLLHFLWYDSDNSSYLKRRRGRGRGSFYFPVCYGILTIWNFRNLSKH